MEYQQFRQQLMTALPEGDVLPNLQGDGTTTIVKYTDTHLVYRRRNSNIWVATMDLYNAYEEFRGTTVSSTSLKKYAPHIFNSHKNGHSCNCTLFFMALRAMGIVTMIQGSGKQGDPFRVDIPL